jgi:ATP-dependent protease HslVU (ClpYQ) peptidase subunit
MTCVVGLLDKGKIYMGADSAGVGGMDLKTRKDPKVFIKENCIMGNMIIGYTSSFRMGQLLRYSLNVPDLQYNEDVFKYMATKFVNETRNCFKEGGYSVISNNEESGGEFLVGFKGRLFCIYSDFQVEELHNEYNAVGCGASYALGSLYSTSSMSINPSVRVTLALEASEAFSAGVRGPFNILSI